MWLSKLEPQIKPVRTVVIDGDEYVIAAIRVTHEQLARIQELLTAEPEDPKILKVRVSESVSSGVRLK